MTNGTKKMLNTKMITISDFNFYLGNTSFVIFVSKSKLFHTKYSKFEMYLVI